MNNNLSARKIAWFAILLTLVIVLQIWGSAIPFAGKSLNLNLIPVVLSAIILGPFAGMMLGIVVGIIITMIAANVVSGFLGGAGILLPFGYGQ